MSQTGAKRRMPRRLVWIDEKRFRGFGCSECAWVFNPSGSPTGNSLNEMMRNFELQRDKEFTSHVCAKSEMGISCNNYSSLSGGQFKLCE